ncbi:hypothetical protein KVR01_012752 [Diaporthe batatas]|uniref:uncharacterized protein n=1 Tax=Diaporthe batatas TaxID=748121 RepID=UPI001D03AD93|nr:uncharacterized protein KVR01_012752 [Diaporthe batatas]KAG8157368.1 hypothetical protein KVR01_012752 [Diaporthe batatas]
MSTSNESFMMDQPKQTRTTDHAEPKLLRKLGNNEIYQLAMYLLDQYRGTSVSGRYSIPTSLSRSGTESRNKLVQVVERAIIDTVLNHPVLQVAIADAESQSPRWVQLETLNLRHHVTWHFKESDLDSAFEKELQDLLADEVDATYPELDRRPGWRIVVIHFHQTNILEIVFTWNHPHCDGMSGKIFHSGLLQALNSVGTDAENVTDDRSTIKLPDSPPELPPPVEEICKLPLTVPFILKTLWNEWGPTTFKSTIARWAPIPPRSSPFKTQVRAFTVDAEPLRKVLFACRQHKTTLTGLLHILTLTSLASQLTEEAAPAFTSGTTVDMRRYIDPKAPGRTYPWFEPQSTMGNFVTIMSHEFERGIISQFRSLLSPPTTAPDGPKAETAVLSPELTDLVWSTAARVRRELEDRVQTGLKNDMVGMMRFIGDWQQEMTKASHRPRQFSWWVSGIGVLDPALSKTDPTNGNSAPSLPAPAAGNGDDSWVLRRAQFILSTETTAAAINISPMTVAGERLCVGASWQDCLFDVSLGERVMADLEAWLSQLA